MQIILSASPLDTSLIPRPSKFGGGEAWYTLFAHVCQFPQLPGKTLYSRTPPCYDYV